MFLSAHVRRARELQRILKAGIVKLVSGAGRAVYEINANYGLEVQVKLTEFLLNR